MRDNAPLDSESVAEAREPAQSSSSSSSSSSTTSSSSASGSSTDSSSAAVAASEGAAASVQTSSAAAPKGDGGDDPPESAPLEGTGEGPPPGTRLEGLLVSLVALAIIIIPVMACLDRVRGALASATHLTFVAGPLAKVLAFLLPRDMSWGSVYVQNGTLWIGFLGALLAAAGGKHLGLATTNFMKRGRLRSSAEGLSTIVFTVVALALGYASARMVATDRSSGDGDLLPGGFHKWGIELIIPVAFVLMAVRVVMRATDPIAANAGPHGLPSSDELIPIKPLTRRGQLVRWGLIGLTTLLAALVMYVGFRYDNSERIQAAIGRLDGYRTSIKTLSLAAMAVAFLLGTPVFIIMAGTAMALFFASDTPVASLPSETFRLVANPSLPAIPLLTIAGYVLASGRSSQRLVRAYKSLLGWMPGGMALMVVFVCGMFTTFTGASGVTILALGGLVFPMLVKDKYPEGFSMGLVTASGSLGLLFPPSLPVILYAVAASTPGSVAPVSVEQLYIGGLIPGLVLLLMVSAYGIHRGIKSGAPRQAFRKGELLAAWRAAKWDLLLPIIVIAAFVSGLATVVEAAALGAAYAILVELIVYRDLHPFRSLPGVLVHAATLVGAVVVLLGVAMGLTNYLVLAEIPTHLVDWVQAHIHSQWLFLIVLNIMLLILGSVLEIYSAIVVLVPLVAPLGVAFNVHPVHLGVIFLANLELGFLCPPMGLNLFLAASRFHKPLPVLYRQALPFLLIMSVGVLFITYVESATMGLLRLFGKQ